MSEMITTSVSDLLEPEAGTKDSRRSDTSHVKPRLGFLGVGWIGRHRMDAVVRSGVAEVVAVADPSLEMREAARQDAPNAECLDSLDALLAQPLDGIVVATPSALHAEQSILALESGCAVFCQKPLGRTRGETERVIEAARRNNRLLGVDLSYREVRAFWEARARIRRGDIGDVYTADLVFHNAYGPDKPWFYDPVQSGGGCVMDLGIHMVDMALWTLGSEGVQEVRGRLFSAGRPITDLNQVEDYAIAEIELDGGVTVRIACSWNLHAGQDAEISACYYGTEGGLSVRNVSGSFYDFETLRFSGTGRETLVSPPDDWGGRATVAWAKQLASGAGFDASVGELAVVAEVLDRLYARG